MVSFQSVLKCWGLQFSDKTGRNNFYFILGARKPFVLKFSLKKVFFFMKSNYVGTKSMMMIFFNQIYIVFLPIQQGMKNKKIGQRFFFGRHVWRKGANMQKSNALKKLCSFVLFFNRSLTIINTFFLISRLSNMVKYPLPYYFLRLFQLKKNKTARSSMYYFDNVLAISFKLVS